MKKLINLTNNTINIIGSDPIPPSGIVARITSDPLTVDEVNGVQIFVNKNVRVYNIPEPVEGVYYIVPSYIRVEMPHRDDLVSPANVIRDKNRAVQGCTRLECNL